MVGSILFVLTFSKSANYFGIFLGIIWELLGNYLGIIWELFRNYLGIIWELFGNSLEHVGLSVLYMLGITV